MTRPVDDNRQMKEKGGSTEKDGQEGTAGFAPALSGQGVTGKSGTSSFDADKPVDVADSNESNKTAKMPRRSQAESNAGRLLKTDDTI